MDFLGGSLHGALSLFGFGSIVDPMGDARSGLSKAVSDMNHMTSTDSLASSIGTNKNLELFMQDMAEQKTELTAIRQLSEEMLWEDIGKQTLFMKILAMIVLLIIVFLLAQKKCC